MLSTNFYLFWHSRQDLIQTKISYLQITTFKDLIDGALTVIDHDAYFRNIPFFSSRFRFLHFDVISLAFSTYSFFVSLVISFG